MKPRENRSIEFFDAQFRRQIEAGEFRLNPFESRALDHLAGSVLDLGCGLGNLSLAAARRGHAVFAVDASPAACARLCDAARAERLPIEVVLADASDWRIECGYTTIVSIGLLMFLRRERALALLASIQEHVEAGGTAIVNALVEGTTYMDMFDPHERCLFGAHEIEERFAGWRVVHAARDVFDAPGGTQKVFSTVIARKPA